MSLSVIVQKQEISFLRRYISHNLEIIDWQDQRSNDVCKEFTDYFSAIQFLKRFQYDTLAMMDIRLFATGGLSICLPDYSDEKVVEIVAWRLLCGEVKIVRFLNLDDFQTHTVKQGESLSLIAKQYDLTLKQLLNANPDIKNPDLINIGQSIKIPSSVSSGYYGVLQSELESGYQSNEDFSAPKQITQAESKESHKGSATIIISVVNSYDEMEGIAHSLKIESTFDNRIEKFLKVNKSDAVRMEYGLTNPFIEGTYNISISPLAPEKQKIGPKKLIGDDFKKTIRIYEGKKNTVIFKITRKQSILYNIPLTFKVKTNSEANDEMPYYELHNFNQVSKHVRIIESEANSQKVDVNLIKSIVYMETTHGYYDLLLRPIDKNKSILPMNVRSDYWKDLGYSREELKKPEINIKAGVLLLKRISERVQPKTIENISTIYQNLGATKLSDYGARVKKIYDLQKWNKPEKNLKTLQNEINEQFSEFERLDPLDQVRILRKMFGGH